MLYFLQSKICIISTKKYMSLYWIKNNLKLLYYTLLFTYVCIELFIILKLEMTTQDLY